MCTSANIEYLRNEIDMLKAPKWILVVVIGIFIGVEAPALAQNLTGPQRNAVRSPQQYLNIAGFSRDGLIRQLSSDAGDGYSVSDATIAVDSLKIDWNAQAARSAKQYLSLMGFSCRGLVRQLSSSAGDRYTVSEANHGAKEAGAC